MTPHPTAGVLIVGGSVIFLLGAAIGVPTVFLQRHHGARLRLLQDNLTSWRIVQPLYGLGPMLVAAGVGVLATEASSQAARTAVTTAWGSRIRFGGCDVRTCPTTAAWARRRSSP